jgi:hypothetical protein
MNVFYSNRYFKQHYDQLPPESQMQFKLIDAQVKAGDLSVLKQNGWMYYASVGGGYIAWGNPKGDGVFLWRDVDVPAKVPVIL